MFNTPFLLPKQIHNVCDYYKTLNGFFLTFPLCFFCLCFVCCCLYHGIVFCIVCILQLDYTHYQITTLFLSRCFDLHFCCFFFLCYTLLCFWVSSIATTRFMSLKFTAKKKFHFLCFVLDYLNWMLIIRYIKCRITHIVFCDLRFSFVHAIFRIEIVFCFFFTCVSVVF